MVTILLKCVDFAWILIPPTFQEVERKEKNPREEKKAPSIGRSVLRPMEKPVGYVVKVLLWKYIMSIEIKKIMYLKIWPHSAPHTTGIITYRS